MAELRQHGERQARLLRMGDALRDAAAAADWTRLGEHANALAPQLQALAARGPWSPAERQALLRLRTAHDAAFEATAAASNELAARLEQLRTNKEGWAAYAMHSDTESGMSQG
jgi:hypothetical protein